MTPAPAGAGKHKLNITLAVLLLAAAVFAAWAGSAEGGAEEADEGIRNIFKENINEFEGSFLPLLFGRRLDRSGPESIYNANHPLVQRMGGIILELLVPVYMALILLTGIYYIWGALSPRSRAQSKTTLQKLVLGMIACSLAFPLFNMVVDLNNFMVAAILSVETGDGARIVSTDWGPVTGFYSAAPGFGYIAGFITLVGLMTFGVGWGFACGIVCILIALMMLPYIVLFLRNTLLLVFAIFFPMTIFFMSFDFLKGLGYRLFKTTMTWIFFPVPMAIFIVLTNIILRAGTASLIDKTGLPPILLRAHPEFIGVSLAAFVAYAMVGMAPMMMTSLIRLAGGAFIHMGQTGGNTKLSFIGYVMQGYNATALTQTAFQANRAESREISQRETAQKYEDNIKPMGSGAPDSIDAAQPPPPDFMGKAIPGFDVFNLRKRFGWGDKRAAVPPEAMREKMSPAPGADYMSGVRHARNMAAEASARGEKKKAFMWRMRAGAEGMKMLMVPAGVAMQALLRQMGGTTPLGKTLIKASHKMTGYWERDPETGKWVFNYGWRSFKGMSRDAKRASVEAYDKFEKEGGVLEKGRPPAVKAAMTAAGISLPAAFVAGVVIGGTGLGLAVIGGAAAAAYVGTHVARARGRRAKRLAEVGGGEYWDEADRYVKERRKKEADAGRAKTDAMMDTLGLDRREKDREMSEAVKAAKGDPDAHRDYLESHPEEKALLEERTREAMGKKHDKDLPDGEKPWAEMEPYERDTWLAGREGEQEKERERQLRIRAAENRESYIESRPEEKALLEERTREAMGKKHDKDLPDGEKPWAEMSKTEQDSWLAENPEEHKAERDRQLQRRYPELDRGEVAVKGRWDRAEAEAARRAELADHMASGLHSGDMDGRVVEKRGELGYEGNWDERMDKATEQRAEAEQNMQRVDKRAQKLAVEENKDWSKLGEDDRRAYREKAGGGGGGEADYYVNRQKADEANTELDKVRTEQATIDAEVRKDLYETGRESAWGSVVESGGGAADEFRDKAWGETSDERKSMYMESARDRLGRGANAETVEDAAKTEAAKDSALLERERTWSEKSKRRKNRAASEVTEGRVKDHMKLSPEQLEQAKNKLWHIPAETGGDESDET